MRHARAKVLGGCSSHNSCIAFWPPAECLDEWVEMGATGWSAAEVLPLEQRRRLTATTVRLLRDVPPEDPCGAAVLEAAAMVGLPTVAFNRGETVRNGAGWFQINAAEDGTRMSSSHAYLHPILDSRRNLEVRTGCWVSEILFDDDRCRDRGALPAAGPDRIRHRLGAARGHRHRRRDRHPEVVDALRNRARACTCGRSESTSASTHPGVGSNLDDHVEGLVFWEASRPMVTTSTQWWEIGLFTTVDEGVTQPDLMMHYGSVPFDMNTLRRGYPTTDNGFCLTPNVTQGRSGAPCGCAAATSATGRASTRATSPIPRATTTGSC